MTRWLLLGILVFGAASPAVAQRLSVGVGAANLRATTLGTPAGELVEIPRFQSQELGVDVAIVVTDRLTALGSLAVHRRASLDQFGRASGVGDARIGMNMKLAQPGGWLMAVRAVVQAPTGDPAKGGAILPTGTGAWEGEGVFSVARVLVGGRLAAALELGHHLRGKELRDGGLYGGRISLRATDRVTLAWAARGLQVYQRRPGLASIASASGLGDGVSYTSFGPSASIGVARGLSLDLGVYQSVHVRNRVKGVDLGVGVTFVR